MVDGWIRVSYWPLMPNAATLLGGPRCGLIEPKPITMSLKFSMTNLHGPMILDYDSSSRIDGKYKNGLSCKQLQTIANNCE